MSNTTPLPRRWAAYTASAAAAGYGAVSLYWALGGSAGLRTVGGFAEQMAGSHSAQAAAVVWAMVGAKAIGVALPLGLVRAWGKVVPRRWRAIACGGVGVSLFLYGAVQVAGEALVELGVVRPQAPVDWLALRWHLWLWDPWFVVWGLLLMAAAWHVVGEQPGLRPKASSEEEAAELHPEAKRSFSAKPASLGMPRTTNPSLSGKERMSLSPHAAPEAHDGGDVRRGPYRMPKNRTARADVSCQTDPDIQGISVVEEGACWSVVPPAQQAWCQSSSTPM